MERCTGRFFNRKKIAMPKPSPNRQNRMPISSSLWPSMAPLRKLTCERSGSFREASPPAASAAGSARAVAALTVSSAATAAIRETTLRKAAVASHVRIKNPPKMSVLRNLQTCLGTAFRKHHQARDHVSTSKREHAQSSLGHLFRNSEHASTANQ